MRARWMKSGGVGLLLCALLAIVAPGCKRQAADDVVKQAQTLLTKGDPTSVKQAATLLAPMVKSADTPVSIKDLYVICLIRSEQVDLAIPVAEELATRHPDDFVALYLAGKLNYDKQNFTRALPYLTSANHLRPANLDALMLAAFCAGRENDARADKLFEDLSVAVTDRITRQQVYNEWGLWLAATGKGPNAIAKFNKALDKSPGDPDIAPAIYLNMAVVYEQMGLPKVAFPRYMMYVAKVQKTDPGRAEEARKHAISLPR